MKLASKSLPGILHNLNKGCMDWGWQGMVAYGCQDLVVVVDPRTVQIIQTLDRHKGYVVKVKWARENYHHDLASPYTLRLASADYNGRIITWDVAQASIRAEFSDGSKPVADMEWVSSQEGASRDLLAVLHPPNNLVLWNADTGTKLWKKSYVETLINFAFDPFNPTRLAFLGPDCIVFVDDFSVSKTPSSNGKKYYISSPGGNSVSNSASSDKLDKKAMSAKSNAIKRMSRILVGESMKRPAAQEATTNTPRSMNTSGAKEEPGSPSVNDCLQLAYHRSCRHHLILVYPREISILDLEINQTVGTIPIDRTGSPFAQVLPLQQRDVLMFLHDNGGVTVRVRRRAPTPAATPAPPAATAQDMPDDMTTSSNNNSNNVGPLHSQPMDCTYDLRCQSDPLRITKNNRVFGVACCPVSESRVALVLSDSRLLFWELNTVDYQPNNVSSLPPASPLYTPGLPFPMELSIEGTQLQLCSEAPLPKAALSDMLRQTQTFVTENQVNQNKHGVLLKFVLTGLLNGIASPPVILRMCPPLTTKNWAVFQPLVALGTQSGIIQVVNLSSGTLIKEFSVHSCPVRGIEWVSLYSFLSFAYPSPSPSSSSLAQGAVKNELVLTDIQTGKSIPFRPHRDEESPIDMVKVSYLKQYFVVVFKEKPFELWDLRSGTMLRQMPKNFPHITALEWSPSHNLKSLKKKLTLENAGMGPGMMSTGMGVGMGSLSSSQMDLSASNSAASTPGDCNGGGRRDSQSSGREPTKQLLANLSAREHFVFTDQDGLLYHFIVEGSMIKDGSKIPPDGGMGAITCIAWKGETLVLGDVDGNLNLWDLKNRVSRAMPTHKGWIRKIKFAPGRGNMKLLVLYNDGIDIWDAKEVEVLSSVKTPRDLAKIADADWAASDRPILSLHDGTVRVFDLMFRLASAPMEESQLPEPVLSPHLLAPKAALSLKCLMQHQPWNAGAGEDGRGGGGYKLQMAETDDDPELARAVNEQIRIMDSTIKTYLPSCHFGTAQRCLITARLFGDESEIEFWTVALHYLRAEKAEPGIKPSIPRSTSSIEPEDLFVPTTPASHSPSPSQDLLDLEGARPGDANARSAPSPRVVAVPHSWSFIKDRPLETCYDMLCDNHTFQKYQLNRIFLHDVKRATYEHTKKCAENLMMLGETDRAVQLLLETEAENDSYYVDCLRACLVASIRSSGASQSTIKLVATNLIASGKLSEGVQLLCLIDKGLDACRYLQTYDQWHHAAWLAKATLSFTECSEVMRRWADYLSTPQVNQKSLAVLVMLSLGQFVRVIEMLYHMRNFDRAALFIEACQEFDLLDNNDETAGLIECVYVEYARHLLHLGQRRAAEFYCSRASDKGQQLLHDILSAYSGHGKD